MPGRVDILLAGGPCRATSANARLGRKAKRALPIFPDVLNEPILIALLFPFGVVPGDTDKERKLEYEKRVVELRIEKLLTLLKHYRISSSDKNCWLSLAYHLSCDCVPGMAVVDRPPRRARPLEKWGRELRHRFYDVVEAIRGEKTRRSIVAAIRIARQRYPSEWGRYKESTLETRYYELKKKKGVTGERVPGGLLDDLLDDLFPMVKPT